MKERLETSEMKLAMSAVEEDLAAGVTVLDSFDIKDTDFKSNEDMAVLMVEMAKMIQAERHRYPVCIDKTEGPCPCD